MGASSPIVVRGAGDLLTAFAVDGDGRLWFASTPTVDGEFMPWRRAVGTGGMSKQFTVLHSGNDFEIVYRTTAGLVEVKKLVNGTLGAARTAAGLTTDTMPSAVVFADNKVQIVARGADNKLYTQKETASGFTGWTDIRDGLEGRDGPAEGDHRPDQVTRPDSTTTQRARKPTLPGPLLWSIPVVSLCCPDPEAA